MNYAEKAMQYKGKSLDDMCMMTIVTKSDLTDNDRATLVKDGWELDDEFVNEWIPQEEMTKLEGNYDDFETKWDFDEFDNIINDIIKPSEHGYLVVNTCANWRGSTGYRISDSVAKALERDYPVTQTIIGASKGGKVLLLSEASHDVPMGALEYVIALNKYERSLADREDFRFADQFMKKLEEEVYETNG